MNGFTELIRMRTGKGITEIVRLLGNNFLVRGNDGGLTLQDSLGDFVVYPNGASVRASTFKLLLWCINKRLKQGGSRSISISVDDYARLAGRTTDTKASRDNVRKSLRADVVALYQFGFDFYEARLHRRNIDRVEMRILDKLSTSITGGKIELHFAQSFIEYLDKHGIGCEMPRAIFDIPNNQPAALQIFVKLWEIARQLSNQRKGRDDFISFESLLKWTTAIPSFDTVSETDRAYSRRIMKPFASAMDTLVNYGVISSWHFMDKETKEPVKLSSVDYSKAMQCHVVFHGMNLKESLKSGSSKQQDHV